MSANSDSRRAAKRMEMHGKKLVNVDPFETGLLPHADYRSQEDRPLSPAQFVEQFVGTMFVNWLALKTSGFFLDHEIGLSLNEGGAYFVGASPSVRVGFGSPAHIPHPSLLPVISKHFAVLVDRYLRGEVDSAALEAEKARNRYADKVEHCRMAWINASCRKANRQ